MDVTATPRGSRARPSCCSRGSTTSAATRSGSTSCRGPSPSRPTPTTSARPGRSTCAAGRAVRPGQAAAHGAHRAVELGDHVRFERVEHDGRQHSPWVLDAEMLPETATARLLTMRLHYGGRLWMPVLDRLLADEIERSRPRLLACVAGVELSSALPAPGGPALAAALELERQAEGVAQRVGGEHVVDRPGGRRPAPARSRSTWVEPTGISSTWWVTRTVGGPSGRRPRRPARRPAPPGPARSSPAVGSSRSTSPGSPEKARASSTRWRSPEDSVLTGRSAPWSTWKRSSSCRARARSSSS